MKKVFPVWVLLVCFVFSALLGCVPFELSFADEQPAGDGTAAAASPSSDPQQSPAESPAPTPVVSSLQDGYCAWIPYWDYASAFDEVDEIAGRLSSLVGFAGIFNTADQPFLLPDMQETQTCLNILYSDDHAIYLSVVNDVELEDSVYDNKSSELLWRLLGSDSAIDAHIEDLMTLMHESGAEGLEIDYEAIQSDVNLWQRFVLFIERLYARTLSEGYPLRVVLAWDAVKYATFPEGPQYSIMCYNLYGFHSGPGPKADKEFLNQVFSINRALPGQPAVALATGGFDWCSDGSIVALTQTAAIALRDSFSVPADSVARDTESGALFFSYADELGLTHEVWYADGETLSFWRSLAQDAGYRNFDLFRLGGNSISDLTGFFSSSASAASDEG
jgi:spore germination protein YaaH